MNDTYEDFLRDTCNSLRERLDDTSDQLEDVKAQLETAKEINGHLAHFINKDERTDDLMKDILIEISRVTEDHYSFSDIGYLFGTVLDGTHEIDEFTHGWNEALEVARCED